MMSKRVNSPKSIHSVNTELIPYLKEKGIHTLHATSLQRFFAKTPKKSLDDFFTSTPNLPERLKGAIEGLFVPFTTTVETTQESSDGSTTKLGIKLQDGQMIETVIMRYNKGEDNRGRPRISVCISSQVGCKMGCTFCATGTMGLKGHLTSGEIVEQLVHASNATGGHLDNVVFMGMGEPLDNYDAVVDAIKVITDGGGLGLAPSKICVSTVGLIPRMRQFMKDMPDVKLALSLHAPTQDLRLKIVPTAKAYPLEKIMEVVDEILATGKQLLVEYVLIKDLNCTSEIAHQLGALLGSNRAAGILLNLIPYNPTDAEPSYERPTDADVDEFERIVAKEYGIKTTVRRTMGDDIDGACGQLVKKAQNGATKDLEDLYADPTASSGLKNRKAKAADTAAAAAPKKQGKKAAGAKGDSKKTDGDDLDEDTRKQIEEEAEEGLNVLKPEKNWYKELFPYATIIFAAIFALSFGLVVVNERKKGYYESPFFSGAGQFPKRPRGN
ncbi:hypothetical protein HDU96_000142 [Phlyctochytrium bullatum]|nr:hypothetical protein HDU96_000142 [Phlyctochytrium bullatum]